MELMSFSSKAEEEFADEDSSYGTRWQLRCYS